MRDALAPLEGERRLRRCAVGRGTRCGLHSCGSAVKPMGAASTDLIRLASRRRPARAMSGAMPIRGDQSSHDRQGPRRMAERPQTTDPLAHRRVPGAGGARLYGGHDPAAVRHAAAVAVPHRSTRPAVFVGLDNFRTLFGDPRWSRELLERAGEQLSGSSSSTCWCRTRSACCWRRCCPARGCAFAPSTARRSSSRRSCPSSSSASSGS